MDMKTGKPVGSVIPQENGDCIIRYGHNPDQPMQEDVVSLVCNPRTTVFKAAGIVCGRLELKSGADDGTALNVWNPEPDVYKLTDSWTKACRDSVRKEGEDHV